MDILHKDIFYQCLVDGLLKSFLPDPEPPTIHIIYGWSGMYIHFELCSALFLFVTSSELIILYSDILVALFCVLFQHLYHIDMV